MTAERLKERLLNGIEIDARGCWLWQRAKIVGYGAMKLSTNGKKRMVKTHRLAFEIFRGPIPEGLCVLHRCDVPACCNPDHLFLGTNGDNSRDMARKGRSLSGDANPSRRYPEKRPRGNDHWTRKSPERLARGAHAGAVTQPEKRPRGEGHARAKMTDTLIRLACELRAAGASTKQIALRCGVSVPTAYRAWAGKSWQHVDRGSA